MKSDFRQQWVDNAKGLGILFVVATHTVNGLISPGIMPVSSTWDFWNRWFYTFQVPIFFFLSGLLVDGSYEKCGFVRFVKSKFFVLAYPYVLWQTLQIVLMLSSGGATTNRPEPVQLLLFPFVPYMQFWFIYVLLMVFLLHAILKLAKTPNVAVFIVSLCMLFLPRIGWFPYNDWCDHTIYFGLGLMLGGQTATLRRLPVSALSIGTIICVLAVTAAVHYGMGYGTPCRPCGAIIGILAVVLASFLMERMACWKVVSVLGTFSLEIYVSHVIFAASTRIVLLGVFHMHSLAAHICLGLVMGVLGPLLTVWVARRFHIPLFRLRPNSNSAIRKDAIASTIAVTLPLRPSSAGNVRPTSPQ